MAAEYSYVPVQTVAAGENLAFMQGDRCCRKGLIQHRDSSGLFFLKSGCGCNKAMYRATFSGNIALATGATVGAISVALAINGESIGNATAIVTPAAVGDYFNVSFTTYIDVPCACCITIAIENTSTTPIDVQNANIVLDRIA